MTVNGTVYLDHNASTACDPRVLEAMLPWLTAHPANPTSRAHRPGQAAATALDDARRRVARALGSGSPSVVFTSGATEANVLAILGAVRAADGRRRVVTQATEHASVLEPVRRLERDGFEVTVVGVGPDGVVRLDELEAAVDERTALVSLMLANNETGTVQPVADAARIAHALGAPLHCDAAQGGGKLPLDVVALGADLLSVSGHKMYGPKGIGALWRRPRPPVRLDPVLPGGGQEDGLRSGTPNLPGAVGLATALELAAAGLAKTAPRLASLRDRLEAAVCGALDGVRVNGAVGRRLPNTTNLSFEGIDGDALLASLPDVAVSTGSACTSSHPEPSRVLLAMGLPRELAGASLRISVGRDTTEDEIDRAATRVVEEVARLREAAARRRTAAG